MTDPDDLRARAASIFQQLRQRGEDPEETPVTDPEPGPGGATTESDQGRSSASHLTGEPSRPEAEIVGDLSEVDTVIGLGADRPTSAEVHLAAAVASMDVDQAVASPSDDPTSEPQDPYPAQEQDRDPASTRSTQDQAPPATEPRRAVDPISPASGEAATWAATREKLANLTELVPKLPDPAGVDQPETADGRRRHPGSRHPLPRVLAIANQKGGVGKTTTAVNLGAGLAELGYRVLVIDLDPQGNASTGLGVNARNLDASVYDVILHDTPMEDVIEPTTLRNLFVVPATIDLAGAEIELVPAFSRELRLRRAVESVSDDYDFVVIDCPPSLGLLTVNGLAAATEVVVPIQCEYYALEGLGQLLRNVNLVQTNLNARLEISTIVLTMYDARTRLAEQVVQEVRAHFGDRVCRNVVPRTVRLSEAPSFGQPIIVFDPSSRGAIAYRELAKEVSGGAAQRVG